MLRMIFPLMADVHNKNYASGTLYSIHHEISKYFDVQTIGPFDIKKSFIGRLNNFINSRGIPIPRYAVDHSESVARQYGRHIHANVVEEECDVLFATSSLLVPKLKLHCPSYIYTDFSIASAIDYYPAWKALKKSSRIEALRLEQEAFEKAELIFLASNWACNQAADVLNIQRSKLISVKRGANLISNWSHSDVACAVENRYKATQKRFLFVGVDWFRKGGNSAIKFVQTLRRMGFDVQLDVIGCSVPSDIASLDFVNVIPFLSRNNSDDIRRLDRLFAEAFAFLLPTLAEALGIVFCEAASYALPTIALATGGVSEAVEDDSTGFLMNSSNDFDIDLCAQRFSSLILDYDAYSGFSMAAHRKYESELNWSSIGKQISDRIIYSVR